MKSERCTLLENELRALEKATEHLRYSIARTRELKDKLEWAPEELERFESLSSRFSRLADLLIQRVMRLIDELELVDQGSLIDRIERAEKRGWISTTDLVRIRELRNVIAHEYVDEKLRELHLAVLELAPTLADLTPKVTNWARALINRLNGFN